jgi:hypothetical protein
LFRKEEDFPFLVLRSEGRRLLEEKRSKSENILSGSAIGSF